MGGNVAGMELAVSGIVVAVKESMAGQRIIRGIKLFGEGKLAEVVVAVFPIAAIEFGGLDSLISAVVLVVERGEVDGLEELGCSRLD